ncbi:MAG: chorismate synthase [Leptospiraceae bacterium]|nr:chorismate synthase [Leptospiraceae bacterium]MCB1201055.1 chorismate synthase [Leptospiraceae bacterium]
MGSTFGKLFQVTTFGESHGVALGCIIENCPAGLEISEEEIQIELDRRRPGQSRITTPRKEADKVSILSGTFEGKTIGAPILLVVHNENANPKDYIDFKDIYRPSHADYTYDARYGYRSYLGGARSSARATIGIVAAGAIAQKILRLKAGIYIAAYVSQVKNLKLDKDFILPSISELREIAEQNDVRCPDAELAARIVRLIQDTRQAGDSVGGIVELWCSNVPAGLGDPVFDKLDADLAKLLMAIPAVKGVEIGSGFSGIELTGTEHNDLFYSREGKIHTRTNNSGGIQGGISNGEPIFARIAFKPTATVMQPQMTVNDRGEEVPLKVKGRHDPCVVPRAVPIVEAAAALVLCDHYLRYLTANFHRVPEIQ